MFRTQSSLPYFCSLFPSPSQSPLPSRCACMCVLACVCVGGGSRFYIQEEIWYLSFLIQHCLLLSTAPPISLQMIRLHSLWLHCVYIQDFIHPSTGWLVWSYILAIMNSSVVNVQCSLVSADLNYFGCIITSGTLSYIVVLHLFIF